MTGVKVTISYRVSPLFDNNSTIFEGKTSAIDKIQI